MADSAAEKTELQIVAAPAIEKRISCPSAEGHARRHLADLYGVETKHSIQQAGLEVVEETEPTISPAQEGRLFAG